MRAPAAPSLLLSLVAPPRCALCAARCERRAAICGRCEAELASARPLAGAFGELDAAWSAAPYRGAAAGLVGALKFRRLLPLARRAAEAIADAAPAELMRGALVPVPPAPLRLRLRGFDPAEEIALALSEITALELARCLARQTGPRQVGRPRAERLRDPPRVRTVERPPDSAILVDDVVTTGATLSACARALRRGCSGAVAAVTFARSPRPGLGRGDLPA